MPVITKPAKLLNFLLGGWLVLWPIRKAGCCGAVACSLILHYRLRFAEKCISV
ncbi:hypothetical protein SpAn4DRAFT_5141 [Sporomusa ovata]|uniref:Uncharacterized protein n=2 Tax=Sporomusa ovata TaxID=2378 RepID=A0A0U1L1C3_9FIRM|nr:hypothetical protein SpAn4DRAFT_5141 [Sporomusa ovata]